ncbi:MAG: hypothetical protein IIU49_00525 [Spirochaetales bacterium]|nr:hypothetical protein [Spirochaetales bacterium]
MESIARACSKLVRRSAAAESAKLFSEDNHYGLGLSIAKAVVLNHKGSISATSRDGKVTFTVTLPGV